MRILEQDVRHPLRFRPFGQMTSLSFGLDCCHELAQLLPKKVRLSSPPTGQRRQTHNLTLSKSRRAINAFSDGGVALPGSIDPLSFQLSPMQKGLNRTHPRPLGGTRHQSLLAAVRQDVAQSVNLSPFLLTHHHMLIPAMPERAMPPVETPCFLRQVALKVGHETSQLECRLHRDQQVKVVRHHYKRVNLDTIEPLSSS
jgi:hypothetical protein